MQNKHKNKRLSINLNQTIQIKKLNIYSIKSRRNIRFRVANEENNLLAVTRQLPIEIPWRDCKQTCKTGEQQSEFSVETQIRYGNCIRMTTTANAIEQLSLHVWISDDNRRSTFWAGVQWPAPHPNPNCDNFHHSFREPLHTDIDIWIA